MGNLAKIAIAAGAAKSALPGAIPSYGKTLQRKCDCGQHTGGEGECAECKKKNRESQSSGELVHRRAADFSSRLGAGDEAPPIVHEVLRSPGQPLDADAKASFEPRFQHDFSHVRVHSDGRAAESARSVNALAYTVGSNIVFGQGRFSPRSGEGRRLLAHELAHVTQQTAAVASTGTLRIGDASGAAERSAESAESYIFSNGAETASTYARTSGTGGAKVARKVSAAAVSCPANTNNAPADPAGTLTAVEAHAQGLAQAGAILAAAESATLTIGAKNPNSRVRAAFQARFGLPPAQGKGFLNRITGTVKSTQDEALSGELDFLSGRLQTIADNFDIAIEYHCINGPTVYKKCSADCNAADAVTCAGQHLHMLCPTFWQNTPNSQATLLIHEGAHMLWASVVHGVPGSGGRFRHAECYASFVGDLFNIPPGGPACPP